MVLMSVIMGYHNALNPEPLPPRGSLEHELNWETWLEASLQCTTELFSMVPTG